MLLRSIRLVMFEVFRYQILPFKYLTRKMQLMTGMCAAKALVQLLCKRFNDPDFLQVFILITYIPY